MVDDAGEQPTDASLLAAWKGGDAQAGRVLVERCDAAVRRLARAEGLEVDDLVQETLSRVIAHRDQVRSGERFRAYVCTVARRLITEHRRRAGRSSEAPRLPPPYASASQLLVLQQQHAQLVDAVRSLPPGQREVVELFYWHEASVQQMAVALGVPEGTVKSRLFHGRAHLRAALEQLGGASMLEDSGFDAWVRRSTHEPE